MLICLKYMQTEKDYIIYEKNSLQTARRYVNFKPSIFLKRGKIMAL